MSNTNEDNQNIGTVPQSPVVIHMQYLKDLSFENPNAPEILHKADQPPEVDINIGVDTRRMENASEEYMYEVVLTINASAKRFDKTMFIAEIKYGASVSIHDMKEKRHHAILLVEVPRMIFPFARMILANSTQTGGFVPLQMALVDFRAMYLKRFGRPMPENEDKSDS